MAALLRLLMSEIKQKPHLQYHQLGWAISETNQTRAQKLVRKPVQYLLKTKEMEKMAHDLEAIYQCDDVAVLNTMMNDVNSLSKYALAREELLDQESKNWEYVAVGWRFLVDVIIWREYLADCIICLRKQIMKNTIN